MNANQTLSAECTVSERDYVVAHFVHLRPRPVMKLIGWALILLLAVILGYTAWQMRVLGLWYGPYWFMLVPVLYLLLSFLVFRPFRLRRLYRQHAHPGRPFQFSAMAEEAEFQSANGHVHSRRFVKIGATI